MDDKGKTWINEWRHIANAWMTRKGHRMVDEDESEPYFKVARPQRN